ncbi:MAG TPA: hypothetical protein VND92_08800 [Vicinamibacterales bacterium]|nr:hypothetical protein [Vicinamibacterales bacterium]
MAAPVRRAAAPAPPATAVVAPPRGMLEAGVDWLSQPFAFALVAVLVPFSWLKGHVNEVHR